MNYTQNVFFAPKDALTSGDPAKVIRGTEFDGEFDEIATAIASKEDTANKGVASGYAPLDGSVRVPNANLPTTATRWPEWSEVTSKPTTFTPAAHTHAWADITSGVPDFASRWPTWSEVTSKPTTFTPEAHNHDGSAITTGTVAFARLPTGTGASQVAIGNHTHAYLPLSGGTVTGAITRSSAGAHVWHGASGNSSGVITVSTSAPSGGANGDIWLRV